MALSSRVDLTFSIIVATFNAEMFLEETLNSVIRQKAEGVELILIDGKSTDSTIEIVQKFKNQIDYWVSEFDEGIYDAWNKGLEKATGQWIMFLGADDLLMPNAIQAYKTFLAENPNLEYVSSKVELITKDKRRIRVIGKKWAWKSFRKYMSVAHVGSLHSQELFQRYGKYDKSYKITGDYELLLRAKEQLKAGFLDNITAQMRTGGVSSSPAKAFTEAFRAKIETGACNVWEARLDHFVAKLKCFSRSIIRI